MSRRLPLIGFGLLALATVGAFFLIQVLKTAPPLLWGPPTPVPAAINPIKGKLCLSRTHQLLNYRKTGISLALSHADSVGVYIVSQANADGPPVATLSAGTSMPAAPGLTPKDSRVFTWNGRLADGQPAPAGYYYFRIVLANEDRSINLSTTPVQVITQPPNPRILSVRMVSAGAAGSSGGSSTASITATTGTAATTASVAGSHRKSSGTPAASGPAVLSPPQGKVRITFTRATYRRVWIDIYRTDVSGQPQLVTRLTVRDLNRNWVLWNGEIDGQPAPAGTYLVGITAQDVACNQASWPVVLPPSPGTTPHAGVTIRYLSVTPPLTPTVSGSRATVAVDSPAGGFTWRLRRSGSGRVLAHGVGAVGSTQIRVRMPRHTSGLYTLTVRSPTQSAVVPLVASQAGPVAARARVLVVLPMLSWMGDTPVDDTGDGLPDTLKAGDAVSLDRPMVDGPPASLAADASLLNYLASLHLRYQLTTDVALAEARGPSLVDRWGVLFPDGEDFLPSGLSILKGFVRGGGRVLTLGTGTFRGTSTISGFPAHPRASAPTFTSSDPFGAQRGPITPTGGELITELTDQLNLFRGAIAFSGFSQYQPIQPPTGATISAAGIADGTPAIIAFHYGSGTVMEVGLPNFGSSLAYNVDSQQLLTSAWRVLAKES